MPADPLNKELEDIKRILFVDDEPKILDGLRRMLRSMREQWDMEFVSSAPEALARLDTSPFDVIVSDMRMPGIDGLQLLQEVRKRHPEMVRFILSCQTDRAVMLRSVGTIHQFISKPCEHDALKSRVTRACALQRLLHQPSLRALVAGIGSLPSLPSLYVELMEEVRSPHGSIQKIAATIARDISMTVKILQIVNSALFGLRMRVSDLQHAINLLGLETIQGLVLTAQVFEHFQKRPAQGLTLEALWNHSMTVGAAARMIAKAEGGDATFVEEAFLAGLLHDVGVLAMLTKSDGEYEAVLQNPTRQVESLTALEREALGASHAEVGAYLVGLWGIDDPIVEAIAYHHTPQSCAEYAYSPLTIVSAVHAILTETDSHAFEGHATLNEDYFRGANVLDRLPLWRDITAQAFTNGENND